ncbi:TPA: restriction endonuclease subunit S [Streptococcus suis]|nr:restriction endonuclease subunit S [Streptococcus suis]HEM6029674.1 restriction endonuclease subunit S [Streptococcus suis]HEM6352194.1 restriction endonuclease subunit S [Streptococcus suis]HEM6373859.1 restriction endonuclease subunit S [Streptococcus suis]
MKTNNNIPAYRFQGYTDAWELRKLGEVAEIVMGQSPDSKNYTDNPLDNILVQGNADLRDGFVVPRVWTTQVTKTAEKGDLILSVRAPVGDVGRTNYNVVLGRGVAGIKGNEFIYHLLVKMKLFGYWTKLSTGSTFESINSDDIKNSIILFPTLPEQEAIGTFFSTLDRHITLHQRKLDTLKEQKKTYLKLLFPVKGQTKPALRFQGFEDDWEEVRLGEVLVEYNKKSEIENQFELLSSTNSGIEPRSGRVSGESNIGYKIIKRGMVVLSPQNLWLGNINYNAKYEIGIVSPSYKVFNIYGPNELFLATVLRLPQMFFEYAQASVQGASIVRRNLDLDLFGSILVQLPSLPEQEAIGTFFQTLDQEIAQVEDKLASLKEMKKTLLRKLFV